MMKMMTTQEAAAICQAEALKHQGMMRQALEICAAVALHHSNRNRRNKQRQRAKKNKSYWTGNSNGNQG